MPAGPCWCCAGKLAAFPLANAAAPTVAQYRKKASAGAESYSRLARETRQARTDVNLLRASDAMSPSARWPPKTGTIFLLLFLHYQQIDYKSYYINSYSCF